MPVNRPYPGKNDWKLIIFTLARFSERIFKIWKERLLEEANAYTFAANRRTLALIVLSCNRTQKCATDRIRTDRQTQLKNMTIEPSTFNNHFFEDIQHSSSIWRLNYHNFSFFSIEFQLSTTHSFLNRYVYFFKFTHTLLYTLNWKINLRVIRIRMAFNNKPFK